MGAYNNPEIAKDYTPEVVAAWSKAASDITGGIVKGIEAKTSEYEALSKKYLANRAAVEQNKLELLKDIGKNTSGYLGNDWQDTFKGAIDKYAELNLKIANNVGTPEDRAKYQRELASIEATIDSTKQGIVTLTSYSEDADKQLATAGEQGGYAMESSTNKINALLCGNGKISGKRQIIIAPNEDGIWESTFSFSGDLGGGKTWSQSFGSTKVNELSKNGNNLISVIPVIDNNIKSLAESSALFAKETKTVDGKPVSTVKGPDINKYYKNEGEVKTMETDDSQTFANKRVLKKEEFKKDLLESPEFKAQVAGLLNDPQGMVATLNNTFKQFAPAPEILNVQEEYGPKNVDNNKNKGVGIWTLDQLKDPKMLAKAQELYVNSFADYIANAQDQEIYDTDPVSGKVIQNTVPKDTIAKTFASIQRSFETKGGNESLLPDAGTLIRDVSIGKDKTIKVKITKDENGKVTVTRA
jgi:hypothetical protein